MPIARINGRLLHFVHVPKCSGSSIAADMAAKGVVMLRHGNRMPYA